MPGVRREEPEKHGEFFRETISDGSILEPKGGRIRVREGERERGLYPREKLCAQWHKIPLKAAAL